MERRTTEFAKAVIRVCKTLLRNPINSRLVNQAVGAAGSVGANYREAEELKNILSAIISKSQ